MTFTWMSETSGKASMGKLWKAAQPPPMKRTVIRTTNNGWCRAKLTMRLIMQGLLEQNAAIGYDPLAGLHPREHQEVATLFGPEFDFAAGKLAGRFLDKHIVLFT